MDVATTRAVLERRRSEVQGELEGITAAPRDPMAPVSFGKRIGDGTTEAVARLNAVGAARELSSMLADVERALEKLEEGTYGRCDSCEAEIPQARLEARPWSVLCVRCASGR
jgi:RNA polymerase-binding transcription factor